MDEPRFQIRRLARPRELAWAEALQRTVWGFVDAELVPVHTLLATQKNGGLVLGALDESATGAAALVGLAYGFAGRDALGWKHHSHILGVHPEWRGRGVGASLKAAQRAGALESGLARITWTFDPLMAGNAYFNLHKLGAVACRYELDVYGEIRDELNRGLPTDRLDVDWWLRDDRARPNWRDGHERVDVPIVTTAEQAPSGGWRVPTGWRFLAGQRVRAEIPSDILRLKNEDADAARAWRTVLREVLTAYFGEGYAADDVLRDEGRFYYLLTCPASEDRARRETNRQ